MTKSEERKEIQRKIAEIKTPIRKVTKDSEIRDYTDLSMRDGENGIIRNYHFQDGSTGIFRK